MVSGKREGFLLQNVNVLLGGAMLSGLVLLVAIVCCCCRFNTARKPVESPSSMWLQDDEVPECSEFECDDLERSVYTVDVQSVRSSAGAWPSPPPPYSTLRLAAESHAESASSLPSYDTAMQLQQQLHQEQNLHL